jgi:hypothetical protein
MIVVATGNCQALGDRSVAATIPIRELVSEWGNSAGCGFQGYCLLFLPLKLNASRARGHWQRPHNPHPNIVIAIMQGFEEIALG